MMSSEWLITLVIMGAAVAAASVTLSVSHVTESPRTWVRNHWAGLGALLDCPWCTSHWVALGLLVLWTDWPMWEMLLIGWLATVAFSGVFMRLILGSSNG
jgi:hypothetical protein